MQYPSIFLYHSPDHFRKYETLVLVMFDIQQNRYTKYVNKTVAVSCHERQESNVCLSMLVQARFPSQVETTSFNQALSRIVYRAHMFRAHNGNGLSRFSSLELLSLFNSC